MNEVDTESGWYISDSHATRALGYMSVAMVERGWLPDDFELPALLILWGQALAATMQLDDFSPIDERQARSTA